MFSSERRSTGMQIAVYDAVVVRPATGSPSLSSLRGQEINIRHVWEEFTLQSKWKRPCPIIPEGIGLTSIQRHYDETFKWQPTLHSKRTHSHHINIALNDTAFGMAALASFTRNNRNYGQQPIDSVVNPQRERNGLDAKANYGNKQQLPEHRVRVVVMLVAALVEPSSTPQLSPPVNSSALWNDTARLYPRLQSINECFVKFKKKTKND
ncbi:hypothetical protein KIN20_005034 [Parelaphostrongylus tenuis]|uniref:Uncharacterized protein n=1 Tax=Parelaphostrongylus tenuis TaxID=148309 RepID=A0AAD5M1H5_PARTN|nr:hypothetical protein KIN20_005034 [Parelaphostrongylus tenuis]